MDYEKKYNEALERAKDVKNGPSPHDSSVATVEYIFPELCESEDERIRMWLIRLISTNGFRELENDPMPCGKMRLLDWLEKRKEQKPTSFNEPYNPDEYEVVMEGNATSLKRKEQNSAWSEEDEETIHLVIEILKVNHPNGKFKTTEAGTTEVKYISTEEIISRIKSLRPPKDCSDCSKHLQGYIDGRGDAEKKLLDEYGILIMPEGELHMKARWKPTEEQMAVLLNTERLMRAGDYIESAKILAEVIEQLKKLCQ